MFSNIPCYEAAAEARKKAMQVVQRLDEISGDKRKGIINEARSLMCTAGIITFEQDMQLTNLIDWEGEYWEEEDWQEYFDKLKSQYIANAICEAADNYVMSGSATVKISAGNNSGGVSLKELKIAYGIAYSASCHALKVVKLRDALRKETGEAEWYDDDFFRARRIELTRFPNSYVSFAVINQELWKEELEATRATLDKLELHIVPDIMTEQELQDIIDTTPTSTSEEKNLASVAIAVYDKIETMYRAAELEWLNNELYRIFNPAT